MRLYEEKKKKTFLTWGMLLNLAVIHNPNQFLTSTLFSSSSFSNPKPFRHIPSVCWVCILAPGNQDWWAQPRETVALAPTAVSEAVLLGDQEKRLSAGHGSRLRGGIRSPSG